MGIDATLWDADPGWLNTASYGLPPRRTWEALQTALGQWRRGTTSWEGWEEGVGESRALFARLVGVDAADVAIGSTVSEMMGLVAAALPDGARVLLPDIEFTSNVFPWAVHAHRGVEVVAVPLEELIERIDDRTDLVAVSAVQSATGAVTDLAAVSAAARSHGALVAVDATQAVGWLPTDARLTDFLAVGAYKWLMSPRGSAFLYVAPQHRDRLVPLAAGWYAGDSVHDSYYGLPLRLSAEARRFDISPAWFSWVGTAPSLQTVLDLGVDAIHAHDVGLANRFRAGLGMPPGDSAIVTAAVDGAAERLEQAGIRAATRAGATRLSFHCYSTEDDVDRALGALAG